MIDERIWTIKEDYRKWILGHTIEKGRVEEKDGNIRIETDFALAEVNFYEMEMLVVELRITDKKKDETAFFLHFELREEDYAKELFDEMIETLEELRERKNVQVLLSCTSALTTGLMAERLNEAASLVSGQFHFDAVPFPELYEKAQDYDMILLAPQIAYEGTRIRRILEEKIVVDIPARLFATYDAAGIFEIVRSEYEDYKRLAQKKISHKEVSVTKSDAKILTLTLLSHSKGKLHILCRYYQNGAVRHELRILRKRRNFVRDISDILDTVRYTMEGDFDAIGIATPGAVWHGSIDIKEWGVAGFDLQSHLRERYHVPVVMKNNAQMGVLGFHARHSHYESCVLLTQMISARFGGAGIIVHGKLLEGHHNIAGEIKYIMRRFFGLSINETHGVSSEEMVDTVEFYIRCLIGIVDPEIILIRNEMIPDITPLYEKLKRTVPERVLPKLRKISDNDTLEYIQIGTMLKSLEMLE